MIIAPERIPVAGPSITDREPELAAEAARTAWYGNHYAYNARFEKMMAEYVGVRHAVGVPHATAALHVIFAALGIGPGDEVIVPDVTWIASVAPVVYVGAEPVLVDILPDTWCIDPAAVEAAIGPKTKAILGVDLYGSMCDWDALQAIADKHGLHLIEDAAEALGSSYNGRRAGSFGRAAAFSFHGSKTVATGEGGMFVTDDADLAKRMLFLRDHGRNPGDRFFLNHEVAFKYRMNAVTAALGIAQMERIDELITHKRAIFRWYQERLGNLNGITLNAEPAGVVNSYWMVTSVFDPALGYDKFELMAAFDKRNIDTRPFFSPLSSLPAFDDRPNAKRLVKPDDRGQAIAKHSINLPSGYNMTEEKVDIVCRAMREILSVPR
ncbi:glutamine--scyllo-inositol aminotransferase [Labrys miyagiensis]|uniref:Glutamine--scyllo-inositol aminotransferase n=1 Tax=Labrys miyagiensis TaxID=346912 RepID=A0ABQ6CMJ1_9HYPH|nr:DegT/DnrJ/EryC1/StrS family aminotransferase [Labrys miyagiensis]GLS19476.1 glutamine--scyllo-inositol aminotransferase [Labrys miyagiensis]